MNALNLHVFRAGGTTGNNLRNHGFGGRVAAGNQPIMRAQEDLRAASSALAEALKSLKRETRPIYATSIFSTPSVAAKVSGLSPHLSLLDGHSKLQTRVKINTQASTDRVSSSALVLDLSSASSRLQSSGGLGLDLTSPESASSLQSSAALGLDLTSPDAASRLSSSAALGLDIASAQSASTITSTAEMNTGSTTSYGSSNLSFMGPGQSSTSSGTLSGTFTGVNSAADATSLVVQIKKTSTLNGLLPVNVEFEVRDQNDTLLFSYDGSLRSGDSVYLGADIGLSLSFSSGRVSVDHTASTTVSHNPITVNASAAFNNANVNLRPKFDGDAQVTAGSFKINGTSIAVNANDTINAVIARINASAAGVTASLADDRISLTTNSYSEDAITLSNDTSGFLSATKLSGATTAPGNIRDDQQVLSKTTQFGSVASGSFTINGVSIAVNADTDTVNTLLAKINSASAGVTAAYDSSTEKLVLTGVSNSQSLIEVENDTTGFLAAAHLATVDTVRGHVAEDQVALEDVGGFYSVTDGTFQIDGQTITVDADVDTIQSIVGKINNSGARVTASYDAANDRFRLQASYNSEDAVAVGNDTSGFLSAANLSSANSVLGNIRDDQQVLSETSQFASVVDGAFQINGATIAVDAGQDSLSTLIDKLNAAGAGITATFNAATNRIELESDSDSEDTIAVGNDSSGFLLAAGLSADNTVLGSIRDDQQALSATTQFGGVTDGSFRVNGISIAIDSATDTFETVIGRVNNAGAGVTASYDAGTGKLSFTPNSAGSTLSLEDDTSGFLAAANVTTGTVGTHVNADASFNAAGLNGPLFDPGKSVQAGSFEVNGVEIEVSANDTIRTVVARIGASAAGVTAEYDDSTQTIDLRSVEPSTQAISVGGDTSGFLAAVKFDATAESTTGTGAMSPFDAALEEMSEYAGVTSGAVIVNGHQIAIDPGSTTIRGLVSALNGIPDISASLDETTGKVAISSKRMGIAIALSDTSGLLSALGVATGVHRGSSALRKVVETQTGVVAESNTSEIATRIAKSVSTLNEALSRLSLDKSEVSAALHGTLDALTASGISGLSISGERRAVRVTVDKDELASALSKLGSAATFVDVAMKPLQDLADSSKVDPPQPGPLAPPSFVSGFDSKTAINPFFKRPPLALAGQYAVKAYAFPAESGGNRLMTVR